MCKKEKSKRAFYNKECRGSDCDGSSCESECEESTESDCCDDSEFNELKCRIDDYIQADIDWTVNCLKLGDCYDANDQRLLAVLTDLSPKCDESD